MHPQNPTRAVVFLAYVYPPDPYIGAARPHRFVRYLPRFGYSPYVIAAGDPFRSSLEERIYRVPGELGHVKSKGFGAFVEKISRLSFLPYDDGLSWIPRAVAQFEAIHRRTPVAAVFSTFPPVSTHVAAMWIKKKHALPWVADFRDPLADNLHRPHRIGRLFDKFADRRILNNADAVIANTDFTQQAWQARHPRWRDKVALIYNGFDEAAEAETPAGPPAERGYKLMTHVGSLYGERRLDLLLASVRRLIGHKAIDPARLRIEFVGPMTDECRAQILGFEDLRGTVEILPAVPPQEARRIMAAADCLLLSDFPGGRQVPAKLFEYVRTGHPVLALTDKGGPADRVLSRSSLPYRCVPFDMASTEVDRAVEEFLQLPAGPHHASEWFNQEFNAVSQTAKLASILDAVIAKREA